MNERVRRAELYLRKKYPHLATRIFKLNNGFYGILLEDFTGNFDEIKKEFEYEIKPVATPVMLLEKIPDCIEEELPIINDTEIGKNFSGLSLTLPDLKYLLISKFPMIEIIHLESFERERKLNVYTDIISDANLKKELIDFLYSLDIPMDFYLIENKTEGLTKEKKENEKQKDAFSSMSNDNPITKSYFDSLYNPVMHSFPAKLQGKSIIYEERDEQMWFDKLGEIYAGNFTKADILKTTNTSNSCCIDYSIFDNVNIRNGIVLYDKIYVEPPVDLKIKSFCSTQKIKPDEIIELCKENKLTFILPQPSFRYDSDFLTELYKINPNSILSKRALSSLIICDLVEINKNYFINTLGIGDSVYEMSQIIKEIDKNYVKTDLYNIYMWPQKALRSVLEVFLFGSTYKSAVFGINNIFTDRLDKEKKEEIEFEFIVNSNKVHISSALNSQYFPHFEGTTYSNQAVTSLMGNMLNFYKNSSIEQIQNYVTERQKIIMKKPILPVSLIEVNEYASVTELYSLSKKYFSPNNFNSILGYLLNLSTEEMEEKIIEYNKLVEGKINRRKIASSLLDISITAACDAIGMYRPFFSTGVKIFDTYVIKAGLIKSKKIEKIREAFIKLSKVYNEKKTISFLSKINSVARLRKKYD